MRALAQAIAVTSRTQLSHSLRPRRAFCRSGAKPAATGSTPPKRDTDLQYPERLLVYHAGTGKTVFLGCLKVTTVFVFAFGCLVVGPAVNADSSQPAWKTAAVIAGSAIPMAFVSYTSSPFVAYIHVALPLAARRSRESLLRWARNAPGETSVYMTTLRFLGNARQVKTSLSELSTPSKSSKSAVNLTMKRQSTQQAKARPWYMGREQTRFFVDMSSNKGREPLIWQTMVQRLQR